MELWPPGGSEEVHKGKPRMGSLKSQLPPTPAPDRPSPSSLPLRQQQGPEEFVLVARVGELFLHDSTPSDNTNCNGLCCWQCRWRVLEGKDVWRCVLILRVVPQSLVFAFLCLLATKAMWPRSACCPAKARNVKSRHSVLCTL